uniref:Uncharacterized protein n=1 Tax=Oryza sativa subsp. japonica TaxID=39947 RepID=Q652V9_ORYSJ|nr:hypothetical protein [Oryza sativa Japonica Group]
MEAVGAKEAAAGVGDIDCSSLLMPNGLLLLLLARPSRLPSSEFCRKLPIKNASATGHVQAAESMAGDDASASAAVHAQSVASTAGDGASARAAKGRAFVSAVRSNVAAVAAPNPPPNLAGHLAAVRRQVCPAGYHLAVIKLSHLVGARCSSLVSGPSRVHHIVKSWSN